jgi:hypothetical protein
MSEQMYNVQIISQYLLGSLGEAETERFDGLSITDDQFAEALQAVEKDLVDAYVQDELTGDDLERFKSYYLASPLRSEKVEFARAFHGWAEANSPGGVQDQSPDEVAAKRAGLNRLILGRFSLSQLAWRWGFAAVALTLLMAAGLLVFQNVRLRQQVAQTQARHEELLDREQRLQQQLKEQRDANSTSEQELSSVRGDRDRLEQELKNRGPQPPAEGNVVSLILTAPLRGVGQVPALSLKPGTNQVAAQLQLEAADYSAYRVSLIDPATNETLWRSDRLKASHSRNGRALRINFPASLLKPDTYILQVSGIAANGASEVMSDYPFKVVK